MFVVDDIELPMLGLCGLESGLSEEELAIQEAARRVANEVLRPAAETPDKMSAKVQTGVFP